MNDKETLRVVALTNKNMHSKKFRSNSYETINDVVNIWSHQVRATNVQISRPLIMELVMLVHPGDSQACVNYPFLSLIVLTRKPG